MTHKTHECQSSSSRDRKISKRWNSFGYRIEDLWIDGKKADYPVVNERAVRATAGLMLASAGIAFVLAYFMKFYVPIRIVTALAAIDFAVRLFSGLTPLSPFGIIGSWLVRKQRPEWVGAIQKRFAWSLGLVMASTVSYLVNTGQNGLVSSSLCTICLTLMWMEASLGICLGCKIYELLLRCCVVRTPKVRPACPGGVCSVPPLKKGGA